MYVCTRHFWLKQLTINCTNPEINMLVLFKKCSLCTAISQDLYCTIPQPFLGLSLTGMIIITSGMYALKSLMHLHITLTITHTISYSPGALPTGHCVLKTFPKCFRAPPFIKTNVIYGHNCRTLTSFTNWANPSYTDFKMMSTCTSVDVSDIV